MKASAIVTSTAVALALAACSNASDAPTLSPPVSSSGGSAGAAVSVRTGGTGGRDSPSEAGGAAGSNDTDTQLPEVLRSTVSECSQLAAPALLNVLPPGSANAAYDALGWVGSRYFAFSREALTLFTFDREGALSTQLTQVGGVGSDGTLLQVVFADGQRAVLQTYDASLTPMGDILDVPGAIPNAMSVAVDAGATLVSFVDAGKLHASVFSEAARTDLEVPIASDAHCRSRAIAANAEFAVVLACRGEKTDLRFVSISAGGELLRTTSVVAFPAGLDLIDLKPTASGYVALLHELAQQTAYLVPMDANGNSNGSVRAISGLSDAFALAVSGSGMALTATLQNGTTALGSIQMDEQLTTSDEWSCLDSALPGQRAAVAADADGYALLIRYGNGSEWLLRMPAE